MHYLALDFKINKFILNIKIKMTYGHGSFL